MKTISYLPHTAIDIYGIAFLNIISPQSMDDSIEVANLIKAAITVSGENNIYYWTDQNLYKNLDSDPVTFEREWILGSDDSEIEIPGNWNTVAVFNGDTGDGMVVYSLTYWDSLVPTKPEFGKLTVRYSSVSEVEISTGDINVVADYVEHVTVVAGQSNSPAVGPGESQDVRSHDSTHSQLDGKINKEKGQTPSLRTQFFPPKQLNGTLNDGEYTSDFSTFDPFTTQYIPESNDKDAHLFVSKHLGVGFLEPNNGKIKFWDGSSISSPTGVTGNYEFYLVEWELAVYYFPEDYSIRIFQYNCDTDTWTERVPEITSFRKCIIPSYFNLLPLYISQERINLAEEEEVDNDYEWRLRHIFTYTTEGGVLVNDDSEGYPALYDVLYVDGYMELEGDNSIALDNSIISLFLLDDILDTNLKTEAERYWTNQYYISFQTFKQCLRNFKNWNIQILDCGVVCKNDGKTFFVPYSLYTEPTGFSSLNIRMLPEDAKIDNLLYYDKSKRVIGRIDCLNNKDSVTKSYEDYEDIQMKNGVIVGYKDGIWKGVNQ